MSWTSHYVSPQAAIWQGRQDAPTNTCFFQVIKILNLNEINTLEPNNAKLRFGLLGFSCDVGIKRNLGREGAKLGPEALRKALGPLAILKSTVEVYDVGDITCVDDDLEAAQSALAEAVHMLFKHNLIPIIIGGGHEVAWGHYQGIYKHYPQDNVGIVNFDAHLDMRPLTAEGKGSSGSPFLQIAEDHAQKNKRLNYNCFGIQRSGNTYPLIDAAKKHNVQIMYVDEMQGNKTKCLNIIDRIAFQSKYVYASICLDVIAQPFAPGVSAPQIMGITPWQLMPLVKRVALSGKAISYDIAELSPPHDQDERTAKLAANLVHAIVHYHIKE